MALALRGSETVKCVGEEYTLAIDIEIIDALEDEFGLNFDELLGLVAKGRIGKTTRLLRGLLSRHHPDLTLDDVAELAQDHQGELIVGMERLFSKAAPDEDEEAKGENPPKAHRGTGVGSSANGARKGSRRATSGSRPLELSS